MLWPFTIIIWESFCHMAHLLQELILVSVALSGWEYFYLPLNGMLVHCWVSC